MTGGDDTALRDAELASLRRELACADEALAGAVAARVRLAGLVQQYKRGAGLPTTDPAQEQVVVDRFAELASAAGVPRDAAERVGRAIVEAGRLQD